MTTLADPTPSADSPPTSVPRLAPGVELLGEMAGSGYEAAPSLVRRADGQTLQLTELLYRVLEQIDGERDVPAVAASLSHAIGKTADPDDVTYLIEKKLRPLGVLAGEDGEAPIAPKANPLLALKPRVAVSNPAMTRRITAPFAHLFSPWVVVPMLLGFFAVTGWVLFRRGLGAAAHQAFYQPGLLLAIFALTVVSAGVHEFGHAAACRYGGATPGTMGFGLYIVFPAFYTDVTDSYRLDRRRRLWVDLGGLYFNAILCVLSVGMWAVTGWDALLLLVGTQVLQMLRQLTPVIRADGYHILADLTGVPDLFAHLKPTVASVWPGNWGKRDNLALKRWARVVVIVWVLLIVPSLVFALASGAVALPRLVATAWDSLGTQSHALTAAAKDRQVGSVVLSALKMLALALPVAGTILMLGRVVYRTVRGQWAKGADDPRRRVLTVLAVGAIVLLLGWFWWPRNQYQPISGNERGTVLDLAGAVRAASVGAPVPFAGQSTAQSGGRVPALLLVPQDASRPALVVLRSADGGPAKVLTVPRQPGAAPDANPWPFPFPRPADAQPGNARALSINTADGTAVYDVAYSTVWVTGQDVHVRNDAIALADCTRCTSVAVAFQAVFVVGQSDVVAPVNTSQSLNYHCVQCRTTAVAVQLVVSLTELPDAATKTRLDTVLQQLDQLTADLPHLGDAEIYARLKGIEADILSTLAAAGPQLPTAGVPSTNPGAATPSAAPSPAGARAEPSADPAQGTTDAGTSTSTTGTGSTATSDSRAGSGSTAGTGTGSTAGTGGSADASATPTPSAAGTSQTNTSDTTAVQPSPASTTG